MWTVKSRALREARVGKLWSTEQLAKASGVSERTIRVLEKADTAARLVTIECLAKALGMEPRDLARATASEAPKARAASQPPAVPPSLSKSEPPPRNGHPTTGVTELPRPTRLEEIVAIERKRPKRPPLVTAEGKVPPFTAKHFQDVFTAYATHVGERAYLSGRVDLQRGVPPEEACLIGTKNGTGARFHIVSDIAPGHVIGVTVFTTRAEDTKRLQAAVGETATVVTRVVLVPEEETAKGRGLTFFMSANPKPWGIVVESVVEEKRPKVKRASVR